MKIVDHGTYKTVKHVKNGVTVETRLPDVSMADLYNAIMVFLDEQMEQAR